MCDLYIGRNWSEQEAEVVSSTCLGQQAFRFGVLFPCHSHEIGSHEIGGADPVTPPPATPPSKKARKRPEDLQPRSLSFELPKRQHGREVSQTMSEVDVQAPPPPGPDKKPY